MTTIDKLDISVYNLYAQRTKMIEQINQQYHLDEASTIPPQTHILNIDPKLSELDLLLGILPFHAPWAYFFPPKHFRTLRRSPFSFSRILPSLGSTKEDEEELLALLDSVECQTPEEKAEKMAIATCFKEIDKINKWLGFIVGRVGQFLQG